MTEAAFREFLSRSRFRLEVKARALFLLDGHLDYTRFVILSRGRSGSNFLRGLLNSHSGIVAFGELFRFPDAIGWEFRDYEQYMTTPRLLALSQRDPERFIERLVFRRYPKSVSAVGFKLFYYHARESQRKRVWTYLDERPQIKIIHLVRANLLRVLLSEKKAYVTDMWTNVSGAEEPRVAIALDYDECVKFFTTTSAERETADHYFQRHPTLTMCYEELCLDYAREIKRVQSFLDVDLRGVTPTTYKQSNQPLTEAISNYSELKRRFKDGPWEAFFDE